MVVDADGLNAFDGHTDLLDGRERPLVLTPHPGEMSRLAGITIKAVQADRLNVARSFAREHHLVLVLKGNRTVIALPDGTAWINPTGNPGMATGGTGDILTGMTAGVIATDAKQHSPGRRRRSLSAWPRGRRGRRNDGRTFAGRYRSAARSAGGISSRNAVGEGEHDPHRKVRG